jgi:hypothetical protein
MLIYNNNAVVTKERNRDKTKTAVSKAGGPRMPQPTEDPKGSGGFSENWAIVGDAIKRKRAVECPLSVCHSRNYDPQKKDDGT